MSLELTEENIAAIDTLVTSRKPFPLKMLLIIYLAARSELYVNYMAGFKELIRWLAPIEYKDIQYPKSPSIFLTWELTELANVIGCDVDTIYNTLMTIYYSDYRY